MAGYEFPEFLAETEWLAEHLGDDNLRVIDTDVLDAYRRGHIPGAVLMPDNYQKDPDSSRVHILGPEKFDEMMESLGIGDDTIVVAYDNSRSLYAGRLWWALRYYGHDDVKVLNGGWRKWLNEGRDISLKSAQERPGMHYSARAVPSLIETTEGLKNTYQSPDVVVWDVRSQGEYTGENTRGNKRGGHVPGAAHLEWLETMDEETHTIKPADELRQILSSKGIMPEKEVVVH